MSSREARRLHPVSMATRHFITHGQLPFGGDINFDHFEHTGKFVAPFDLGGSLFDHLAGFHDPGPELIDDLLSLVTNRNRLDPVNVKGIDLFENNVLNFTDGDFLSCIRVDHLLFGNIVDLTHHLTEDLIIFVALSLEFLQPF